MKTRKPWCPYNGCGMPNGAAPPAQVICRCGHKYTNIEKLCPKCKTCSSCGRIGKKHYKGQPWH